MVKKVVGWSIMALAIIVMAVIIGLNGKYIFSSQKFYSESEVNIKIESTWNDAYDEGVNTNKDLMFWLNYYKNEFENNKFELENNKLEIISLKNAIVALNEEVAGYKQEIVRLNYEYSDSANLINSLRENIRRLELTISSYEQYIEGLESDDLVVVTFEFDGSIYNLQIIAKNTSPSINNPSSTDTLVFNGWLKNDEFVDPNECILVENTKFIADLTYKYNVVFDVDGVEVDSQLVVKGGHPLLPEAPIKDGYEFIGYTLNGIDLVEVEALEINADVTLFAKFVKKHVVTFMNGDSIYAIQNVLDGGKIQSLDVPSNGNLIFVSWQIDGVNVDLNSYIVHSDVVIEAVYKEGIDGSYKFTLSDKGKTVVVVTFLIVDGNIESWSSSGTTSGYNVSFTKSSENVFNISVSVAMFFKTFNFKLIWISDNSCFEISTSDYTGSASNYSIIKL